MNVRHTRFFAFLVVSILVLSPSLLAAGEQDSKQEKQEKKEKADASAKAAGKKPTPDSPIYKAAQKPAPKQSEEPLVITNEELDRMWANLPPEERQRGVYQAERHIGSSADPKAGDEKPDGTAGKQPENALEWEQQQQTQAKQQKSEVAAAEAKVAELQARIQELERHALAQRNPLLPRRYSDKKPEDEEEAKDWPKMNNEQRVEATDAALQKAREDLAAAQKDLSRLRGSRR